MSPFAHPLFTVLTGIGFGIAAFSAEWQRGRRVLVPVGGLLLAMGMHAVWNGSATFGEYGFFAVYAAFMVPAFGLLTWLVIWARQRELRTVREALPAYAAAGWLTPAEPYVLGSMRARRVAREYAAHHFGKAGARSVAEYEAYATQLAFLRHRGLRGRAGDGFALRERELLFELWRRRELARPAMGYAGREAGPKHGYGYGYGYEYGGYGYGYGSAYPQPVAYGMTPYPSYNPYQY